MQILIDIHPDMIGSPKEIGELVEKQIEREVNGKKIATFEQIFGNTFNLKEALK